MVGRALKVAAALLVCLVVFDLVGVAVCLFFDVAPLRESSAALPYAVWLVLGVFCGLFSYSGAGQWISPDRTDWLNGRHATKTGGFVLLVTSVCLAALCAIFYRLWWSSDVLGESYVPDSAPLTLTFFGALLAAMAFLRQTFKPDPPSAPRSK